jgi:hypothetical protein
MKRFAAWLLITRSVNDQPTSRAVECAEGIIVINDSSSEKPDTDERELICWHWDHSTNRHVKRISFLTALYQVGTISYCLSSPAISDGQIFLRTSKFLSCVGKRAGK